ncbi:MAG: efeB [Ilumatobacteraceae bacterium]|nr:efeB [Ilumatobacteraceae bacterium]
MTDHQSSDRIADATPSTPTLSRRRLLGVAGATAVGGLALGASGAAVVASRDDNGPTSSSTVAFRGIHQAGIATPAQDRLLFAAFDISANATRDDVQALLQAWTTAADRLTAGQDVGDPAASEYSPPTDTGEAVASILPASR